MIAKHILCLVERNPTLLKTSTMSRSSVSTCTIGTTGIRVLRREALRADRGPLERGPGDLCRDGAGGARRTSRFEDVITRTLPAKFRTVGSVSAAHLTETGEKVLKGAIAFSDPAIAAKANAGELSLSTGLASPEAPDPGYPVQPGSPVR